jgi:hypothetical protein
MRPTENSVVANQVEEVRQRFELWRRDHLGRPPLPQELWSAAAALARRYGLTRTAEALRLSCNSLKQHMRADAAAGRRKRGKQNTSATFVELLPLSSATMPECSVELENARGAKIKIHL